MELLEGTDGIEKMSKSLDNAICFTDTPRDIFGKTMSIPDNLIFKYFRLTTPLQASELKEIEKQLKDPATNPRNLKVRLGYELVKKYYDEESAKNAVQEFDAIFVRKEIPDDAKVYHMKEKELKLTTLMCVTGTAVSTSEASRLIKQGGVSIDGEKITDTKYIVKAVKEFVLKVGKRKFARIIPE
jgi:tyrosyl-tRNA synthetase